MDGARARQVAQVRERATKRLARRAQRARRWRARSGVALLAGDAAGGECRADALQAHVRIRWWCAFGGGVRPTSTGCVRPVVSSQKNFFVFLSMVRVYMCIEFGHKEVSSNLELDTGRLVQTANNYDNQIRIHQQYT